MTELEFTRILALALVAAAVIAGAYRYVRYQQERQR